MKPQNSLLYSLTCMLKATAWNSLYFVFDNRLACVQTGMMYEIGCKQKLTRAQ